MCTWCNDCIDARAAVRKRFVSANFTRNAMLDSFPVRSCGCLVRVWLVDQDHPLCDQSLVSYAGHVPHFSSVLEVSGLSINTGGQRVPTRSAHHASQNPLQCFQQGCKAGQERNEDDHFRFHPQDHITESSVNEVGSTSLRAARFYELFGNLDLNFGQNTQKQRLAPAVQRAAGAVFCSKVASNYIALSCESTALGTSPRSFVRASVQ